MLQHVQIQQARHFISRPRVKYILTMAAMLAMFLLPQLCMAFALDIQAKGQQAVDAIKQGVQLILVVSVLGSGVLAAFGRMSWVTVGQVLIGAIVAGLATEVVDALYGAGG
ncbi:TrbC/VirB2 family protein [Dyella sp.]|uniref:TrbC/VirB2 family protein n=1 Tax=Dyella sp. TaxID=1869338 RepID=UPI002ED63B6E